MSQLRNALIRLASQNEILQPHLLPLLKKGGFNPNDARVMQDSKTVLELLSAYPNLKASTWDVERASGLIENILLKLPVHPIITHIRFKGPDELLDGVWRLGVLKAFIRNKFALRDMGYLQQFEGLVFEDLPPQSKRAIESAQIPLWRLRPEMTDEMAERFRKQYGQSNG